MMSSDSALQNPAANAQERRDAVRQIFRQHGRDAGCSAQKRLERGITDVRLR